MINDWYLKRFELLKEIYNEKQENPLDGIAEIIIDELSTIIKTCELFDCIKETKGMIESIKSKTDNENNVNIMDEVIEVEKQLNDINCNASKDLADLLSLNVSELLNDFLIEYIEKYSKIDNFKNFIENIYNKYDININQNFYYNKEKISYYFNEIVTDIRKINEYKLNDTEIRNKRLNLHSFYYEYDEVIVNVYSKGIEEIKKLVDEKNPVAEYIYAVLYLDEEDAEFLNLLLDSANQKFPPSIHKIASQYSVASEFDESLKWSFKGIDLNYIPCFIDVALSYGFGEGIKQDINNAMKVIEPVFEKLSDDDLDLLSDIFDPEENIIELKYKYLKLLETRSDNEKILKVIIMKYLYEYNTEKILLYCKKSKNDYTYLISMLSDDQNTINEMNRIYMDIDKNDNVNDIIKNQVINIFSQEWNKISEEARLSIITGFHIYFQFKKMMKQGIILDFSAVISSFTKALEIVLKDRIYIPYTQYLIKNNISYELLPNDNIFKGDYKKEIDMNFTLGKMPYIVRKDKRKKEVCVLFIDFIYDLISMKRDNDIFWRYSNISREFIVNYFEKLINETDQIRYLYRNDATHSKIMTCHQAEVCGNYIVLVRKLILSIITFL